MRFNPVPLMTFCLLLNFSLQAQDSSRYTLALKSGGFLPAYNINDVQLEQFKSSVSKTAGKTFAVIQFNHIPSLSERQQLEQAGIALLEYIPNNAYTVTITGELSRPLLVQAGARSVFTLSAEQKMEPRLAKGIYPAWAQAGGAIDVWISFSKGIPFPALLAELRAKNFDIVSTDYKQYQVIGLRVPAMRLQELALLSFIDYVEPAPHADQSLNSNTRFLSRANVLNASFAAGGRELDGEDVTVGVGDNGDAQSHIDFTGRLINRTAFALRGHSAHVHGTIGGAGLIESLYTGYAPKSTLVSQYFSKIFTNAPTYVQDHGMVITNNSFGAVVTDCNFNGLYDLSSRILDQQAIDLPELQQVFAAGNDGSLVCSPYAAGFHTVLGGYQSAKNVLTVGSTEYNGNLSWFSSRGPVRDGRLKPEITSQGQFVASVWITNQYSYNNGTSMAAPGVSGGLALLIQRYRQLHGNANPRNALMKALIVNGGTDRENAGPDFKYGFGSLNLLRSLAMMENNTYLNATVANTATNNHVITVPANTSQLKVLLYWQDPPAAVMASKTLVNDLDLSVVTPSSGTVLPQSLDTTAANLDVAATTAVDSKNNIEQVLINNPASGNYTINVNGTAVTQNPPQEYFLVYDFVPDNSLVLTNPVGGETFVPTVIPAGLDTVYVQWDYYGSSTNDFTLELSLNDGASWSTINNAIPSSSRIYSWAVPDQTVEKARIRITKNGTGLTQTSQAFTIARQATLSLDAVQCEGYIKLNWTAITGATDYEVMMHQSGEMVSVGTTTNLTYTFSGLSKDSTYWVTVRPRINGTAGRRSFAISRKPDSGTCAGTISDRDLKLDSLITPLAGRLFTSTAFTATTVISIRVKNLDDAAVNSYKIKYSLNGGGSWTEETINTPLAGGATATHNFTVTANFAAVNSYPLLVAVENLDAADPVTANDQLSVQIRQLDNQPLNLATTFLDNMESASFESFDINTVGLTGVDRYDFSKNSIYGRVRPFINTGIAYSGTKALSLDVTQRYTTGNTNYLDGTFNLSNYNAASDYVRIDFQFKNHGQTTGTTNKVWVRGDDGVSTAWIEAYDLLTNQDEPGGYKRSASIELSRLLTDNGQAFTPSFQVRWGQYGIDQATDDLGGNGYSFDDVRLYTVLNDLSMVSIDTPYVYSCGLNTTVPVKITVRNTTNAAINNIPVKFRKGNGAFIPDEIIPTIAANTSIQYTFTTTVDLSAIGTDTIIAVVSYPSDSFRDNDTVTKVIVNLPLVTSFPHLQNFETGDGSWYTSGSGTWEYGTPVSPRINRAASGSKAWKTAIAGYYDNNELSYLYSPCYNLTGMTNPTLSFSVAMDIEDCGASLCDGAWMEYSTDGGDSWTKLGAYGQGTNWYNKNYSGNHLWSQENYQRWHVATTALPTTNNSRLRLRFVFSSDVGLNKDGIAIDDIHIYDNIYGIYEGPTMGAPVSQTINAGVNTWVDFLSGGKLVASVMPNNQAMGNTDVQAYINTGPVRINSDQFYHDRNITIKPDPSLVTLADSATVRFYFLDSETETLINATGCGYCTKPSMAYELGVSKYSDPNDALEDGNVENSTGNFWSFINAVKAVKVPFDKGYYAEFKVKDFSEFWLNDGWYDGEHPLPLQLLSFTATKTADKKNVQTAWKTAFEQGVDRFEVQVAKGNGALNQQDFITIDEIASQGDSNLEQAYALLDDEAGKTGVRYYRLKIIERDGRISYSEVKPVVFTDEINWQVFPNPSDAVFNLLYQLEQGEQLNVRIFDASGRVVYQSLLQADGFVQKLKIDLGASAYASGLYLLEATGGSRRETFKLLKK